jgi:hypothetical protein
MSACTGSCKDMRWVPTSYGIPGAMNGNIRDLHDDFSRISMIPRWWGIGILLVQMYNSIVSVVSNFCLFLPWYLPASIVDRMRSQACLLLKFVFGNLTDFAAINNDRIIINIYCTNGMTVCVNEIILGLSEWLKPREPWTSFVWPCPCVRWEVSMVGQVKDWKSKGFGVDS